MAGIYRRGKTWWARAQRAGREHRVSLKTKDRRLAEQRYQQWFGRLEAIAWGDKPRYLFFEVVERFIGDHLPTLKPASARRYGVSLKWLAEKFAGKFLLDIGREELSDFEAWRRQMGASAPTIRRDLACLSSMFAAAEDWEWIDDGSNPVVGFMKRRAKRGLREAPERTRYLSEGEEARLLSAATPESREAIVVAIDTGLRREEQFSLMWSQVDLARGVISTTTDTKSRRSRLVPISARVAQILAQRKAAAALSKTTSVHVFSHEDGGRLVHMNKGLAGATRRAGLKDLRWHDLRRTAGCRWLQRDKLPMKEVSSLLGHRSVTTTERHYAFLNQAKVAEDASHKSRHTAQRTTGAKRGRSTT